MKPAPSAQPEFQPARARAWLLLAHQLPPGPSKLRVRTWRRLQQLGAIAVKQAVYALPDTPTAREDFEWLKTEIEAAGGEATLFTADTVEASAHEALVNEFRRASEDAYGTMARTVEKTLQQAGKGRPATRRVVDQLRSQLAAAERSDFFGAAGRDRVASLIKKLDDGRHKKPREQAAGAAPAGNAAFHRRLWVTRPRPGVDRMASAWLIRRYIDREARFGFVADRAAVPAEAIAFDMFGGEFTHRGEGCTFETLCHVFRIDDPAIVQIARIVHDLDLKDGRFGAPEAATVGVLIDGLQLAHADDTQLLERGIELFDSLYRSFEKSSRAAGLRPVAKRQAAKRKAPSRRKR
jgi:hypothetical protein